MGLFSGIEIGQMTWMIYLLFKFIYIYIFVNFMLLNHTEL